MNTLTWQDVKDMLATADAFMRPWAGMIGLVALRTSAFVDRGQVFAADLSRADMLKIHGYEGDMVLLHPDDVAPAKAQVERAERRKMSDDEFAAYLYWLTTSGRAPQGEEPTR